MSRLVRNHRKIPIQPEATRVKDASNKKCGQVPFWLNRVVDAGCPHAVAPYHIFFVGLDFLNYI
jgi:hypothetical protein